MIDKFKLLLIVSILCFFSNAFSQPDRWQQHVSYEMDIDMNVDTHQYNGKQKIIYTNNSPDTLYKVYFHLFLNAFQPGSMMDVRSRTIADPDRRVGDRISELKPDEIGYLKINNLKQNGKKAKFDIEETILVVTLDKPILPKSKTTFEMEFTAQVPLQIRRSGRDNDEGIAYSMTQWYPKMVEYDYEGWHSNPYIGREFHGVWGDYDVKISIDPQYTIGATGYLQNPKEIGHGYSDETVSTKKQNEKLKWHFKAPNVHDFAWAADPDYKHTTAEVPGGPNLHFFYQPDTLEQNWARLPEFTIKAFQYMSEHFGKYPYKQYSVIQGGDGGMEYPMATLITGHRSLGSLVGVTVHELAHSWYQMILGTNESLYPWMDEGFTSYASDIVMSEIFNIPGDPHKGSYDGYYSLVKSGLEEPLSTHADFYNTNRAYGIASYSKGAITLHQLGYVIGEQNLQNGMKRYFDTWKFKHPNPTDFKRIMEKESGIELDWYFQQWVNTTNTIDYGIKSIINTGDTTFITLNRSGLMPMPIDLQIEYKDGKKVNYYIPLSIMRGEKPQENSDIERKIVADWSWTNPEYVLAIPQKANDMKSVQLDPSDRMADVNKQDNIVTF